MAILIARIPYTEKEAWSVSLLYKSPSEATWKADAGWGYPNEDTWN